MAESPPPAERGRGRFWISVGEGAAVLAVIIAALSFWDSHRQHAEEAKSAAQQAKAQSAFVLRANAVDDGRRLTLESIEPRQVIQSQRYFFPAQVLDHAMEVSAARPQIDQGWIASGLDHVLDGAKGNGEARLPVAIVTAYVEDGETRQDRSLYAIGYAYRSHFLAGRQIILQGLALRRRGFAGDPQAAVERQWKSQAAGAGPA